MALLSDCVPDFTMNVSRQFNVLTSRFANNVRQTRLVTTKQPKRFKLVFVNRSKKFFNYVDSFLSDRNGSYESFTWECPLDSVTYTVHLEGDSFDVSWKKYPVLDFEFTVEEDV